MVWYKEMTCSHKYELIGGIYEEEEVYECRACRGDAYSNFDSQLELLNPSAKNMVEVFGE